MNKLPVAVLLSVVSSCSAAQTADGYADILRRGAAYADKGDFDRAIAGHSEAIRLEADYTLAYKNRAITYEYIGEKAKAQADREKAAELQRLRRKP